MRRTKANSSLKWITQLLQSGVFCWCLCLGLSPLAMADSVLEQNAPTQAVSGGHSAATSIITENIDANGDGVKNEIKVEGNQIKAASKFLFSNIALFASGFIAPTLIKACPKTPSVWIFTGSALLYIANEIGLFTGFNKAINKEMVAYLGRGDEDRQIESLEAASKQTREAKKAAKRRAMISKITAAGFAAASAMAFAERSDLLGITGCKPGTSYFQTPGQGTGQELLLVNPKLFALSPYYFQVQPMEQFMDELSQDQSLYPVVAQQDLKENGLGKKMIHYLIGNTQAQEKVGTEKDAKVVENKDGEKSIVVNSVGAKLAATGLGAAGGFAIMKYTKTAGPAFKKFIKKPITRGIGFGVFSGTAFMAATESEKSADNLESRAQEYDRLADSLRNQTQQNIGLNAGGNSSLIDQTTQGIQNDAGKGSSLATACFKGGPGQIVADSNCSCSQNDSCKKPEVPNLTKLPDFGGQSLLSDTMKNLSSAGSSLYSGRLEAASTDGKKIANNAARITKLRDAYKGKINKDRLAKGAQPIDFEKAEKGMEGYLKKELENAFNHLSPQEQNTLASLGPNYGALNGDTGDSEKEDDDKGNDKNNNTKAIAATDVNANPGSGSDGKNADGGVWDFDFDAQNEAQAEQEAMAAALAEKEDQNYVVKGDINDDRHKNLFNIITRRYLKSAYPVIFEEK